MFAVRAVFDLFLRGQDKWERSWCGDILSAEQVRLNFSETTGWRRLVQPPVPKLLPRKGRGSP